MASKKNSVSPDELYLKTREDLLPFEDARLNSLLQAVANYYTTRNDQSTWGNFLRALAQQLGQFDYFYAYDIVGKDPNFLTPPDVRRRWADPLYVSSNWPSKTQFDTDFKAMLIELIAAYKQGSTAEAIQKVIKAYTGIDIQVQELYKQIGNGVYDQSDRNAIRVSVTVAGTQVEQSACGPSFKNNLSEITTLANLQQIINSLYGAIDLAKPAHVGLEFTTVFGDGDNINCFIVPAYATAQQFATMSSDQQCLYALDSYVLVNPPIFWQKSTPESNAFTLNTLLRDRNGNLQLATNTGKPGAVEPEWHTQSGGVTQDGEITWVNISPTVTKITINTNVVIVWATNNFTLGQQVKLVNLSEDEGFGFLDGYQLSVLTSDGDSFTAAYTHADVPITQQSQGTVSYVPAAKINPIAYSELSDSLKLLYQPQYANVNCASKGIEDTLRIFIRQVEEPPQGPMLIQAPVPSDSKNPNTTLAAWGWKLPATLTAAQYNALPEISFTVVNTVANGINAGFTFSTLATGAPGIALHEGMRVTITGCRPEFNITGKISNVVMLSDTSGTFELPLSQTLASQVETGSGLVTPRAKDGYVLQDGQYVLLQDAGLEPLNDGSLNPPTRWIQVVDKPSNMATGEIANWDHSHPAGLVAPRLDQAWEISGGDQDFIFGMS